MSDHFHAESIDNEYVAKRIWFSETESKHGASGHIDVLHDGLIHINISFSHNLLSQERAAKLSSMVAYASEVAGGLPRV